MNWASDIPNLEYLTRPAEPISYHGMPGPEACRRRRRGDTFQDFGNEYFVIVHYIFYTRSVPMVFEGCLDAGDPTRSFAAYHGINRRSDAICVL